MRFDGEVVPCCPYKMQHDCAVCQCDMGVVQYCPSEADKTESDSVVRLRCGHAFHGTCVALSLRSTGGCPMCRDKTVDNEGAVEISLSDLYESFRDVSSALDVVQTTRTRKEVQQERKELNRCRKAFHEKISSMQTHRKRLLRDALSDFRRTHRDAFERTKHKYQIALSNVRGAEYRAMADLYGDDVALDTLASLDSSGVYSVRHAHADSPPFRNSFWK